MYIHTITINMLIIYIYIYIHMYNTYINGVLPTLLLPRVASAPARAEGQADGSSRHQLKSS